MVSQGSGQLVRTPGDRRGELPRVRVRHWHCARLEHGGVLDDKVGVVRGAQFAIPIPLGCLVEHDITETWTRRATGS